LDIPKTLVEIWVVADCAARIAGKALENSAARANACALTVRDIEQVMVQVLANGRWDGAIEPLEG
jgi:hypothetical protein